MANEKKVVLTEKVYDVLRRPIISEKAAKMAENNGIVFEVAAEATKKDVANAINAIYMSRLRKLTLLTQREN
jgi:large subunit ribosomal protein L23